MKQTPAEKSPSTESWTMGTIVVFLLFGAVFLDGTPAPGLGVPVNAVAMGIAVVFGVLFRRPEARRPPWATLLTVAVPVWVAVVSFSAGDPDLRRLLNIGLFAAVILVISAGRLGMIGVGRGLAVAVILGVSWGAVTLPSSTYVGRLTGAFGDPNTAGFMIAVCSVLAIPTLTRKWHRAALLAVASAGVFLTDSRTSMLAVAVMGLWFIFGRYGAPLLGFAAVGAVMLLINSIPEETFASGAFANRVGSDALRRNITAAELIEVERNPLTGNGAGSARVNIDGLLFFYHSSYLAIRAEAGWIGFVIVVALLAFSFLALIKLPRTQRNVWYEMALIGVAVCALNLGEVLLTVPTAVALGLALRYVALTGTAEPRSAVRRFETGPPPPGTPMPRTVQP